MGRIKSGETSDKGFGLISIGNRAPVRQTRFWDRNFVRRERWCCHEMGEVVAAEGNIGGDGCAEREMSL